MRLPHPIPYQGSKRWIAKSLLHFFPKRIGTLFEPFAGSAAVTLAASHCESASSFQLSDINAPLMTLWNAIIESPESLVNDYERLWQQQHGREAEFFNEIRAEFNRTHKPHHFLFLLARCTKAAVRYNRKGEFNNSPDHRRKGTNPERVRESVLGAARLLKGRACVRACDYREAIQDAGPKDLVYMDPPYQGVSRERDQRYISGLSIEEFSDSLAELNRRKVPYIVSYDGQTGEKLHGETLPARLDLTRFEVVAGRSSTETLLGRSSVTVESVYFSHSLVCKLPTVPKNIMEDGNLPLFENAL